jgi:hypothetical protein
MRADQRRQGEKNGARRSAHDFSFADKLTDSLPAGWRLRLKVRLAAPGFKKKGRPDLSPFFIH